MVTMRGTAVAFLGEAVKVTLIELDLPLTASEKAELRIVESLTRSHGVRIDELSMDQPNRGMLNFTTQDSTFTGTQERLLWRGGLSSVYWDPKSTTAWLRGDILREHRQR